MIPFYVTRKTADGKTGSYSVSPWGAATLATLFKLNAVAWGIVGLVTAVRVLV